jgi:lipopolysaccharide export system protein LptA
MKRFLSLLLLTLGIAVATGAYAEKADAEKPTKVQADQMAYDDVKQINTFTGNVVLTRGTLVMRGHKLTVVQDPAGYQFATLLAAPGSLATFRQKRDSGSNQWVEGQAERIEYDDKSEVVKLFRNARIKRLEGTTPTDEVEGQSIVYDSRAEFFTVSNTASGETKPGGGRVTAVIQPRAETKGK